eukprot:TRINITY_DN1865_c2_g1_i1.p1 TRINITY_DN1865_c2_g1~~TRINITY_DN1865_c2_g1_i1.p1  ORF type:complete len:797 (+),score=176.81 TRINITY_DN1865_c2_g1_i1:450-2840(+)
MNSSFGNSSSFVSRTGHSSLGSGSGDMNRALGSAANSGASGSASSLVTDANSALSAGPHLQRSASVNTESYLRLPASPMSFSSNNNISISGSSVMDGSSIVQQSSHQDQQRQQQQQQGASSATSYPTSRMGQVSVTGPQLHASSSQDPNSLLHMQNKPRLDFRQDGILQQQAIQQMLQRQDPMQLQRHNPPIQAFIQQQKLWQQRNQQQMLQSMPQLQRAQLEQQHMRQQLPQQGVQLASGVKRPYDSGICARRLMQYMYHQRQRPTDNTILYWRKFVAEYFAPRARKRWCFSLYENVGHNTLGVFPQAALDVWQCDICGSKSGRGFEASFEVLPRLNKIKFDSGVIDELLFIDMPHECRFPSGMMMLEYRKAIQESVYEQTRVVREGQLRIIFTSDLKILSWEFCAQRHEEFLLRRLVAPQVNQLVQVAQKYQDAVNESGSAGVSSQNLQNNCNMFISAGRQLARTLDLQLLNDLGFSKRYVRFLQISEVVNSMKDLIDFSREQSVGPIESLKNYPRQAAAKKPRTLNMQAMEQLVNAQGLPTDENTVNKMIAMHHAANNHTDNTHIPNGALCNSFQSAVGLSNHQNLQRMNSMNANQNALQQDISCSFNGPNRSQHLPFQGPVGPIPALQNASVNGLSSSHQVQQELQQNQQSEANQNLQQQHVLQQLLQEIMNADGGVQQPPNGQNADGSSAEDVFSGVNGTRGLPARPSTGIAGFRNNPGTISNSAVGMMPGRSNSFNATANNSAAVGGNAFNLRQEVPQNRHPSELDIPSQFAENGAYHGEQGDISYAWKS